MQTWTEPGQGARPLPQDPLSAPLSPECCVTQQQMLDAVATMTGPPGPTGPTGIQGPTGPQGLQGPQGVVGSTPFSVVATASALPAAAGNAGKAYFVTDTAVIVLSDGTIWRTLYGDTGVRYVQTLMTDVNIVQSAPAPIAQLRRYANTVEFYCDIKMIATAPASPLTLITLPVGFRVYASNSYGPLTTYGQGNMAVYAGAGVFNLYGGAATATYRLHGSWLTSDAWPATLPGTQAAAPN